MEEQDRHEITRLLEALSDGDERLLDQLFAALYDELRQVAQGQRRRWAGNETLNTTALIHEAYLKFSAGGRRSFSNRGHFFAVASRAMRQILIDRARHSNAERRGGPQADLSLDDVPVSRPDPAIDADMLALDAAITRLEALDPRQARVVECRFFGGLDVAQTAEAVGVSTATVKRCWRAARAWLYHELKRTA